MKFTDEMKSFIQEYTPGHHYSEIEAAFNEKFPGSPITLSQVKNAITRYGIKTGFTGQFQKGKQPPNKGKKQSEYMSEEAIERTKATRFTEGHTPKNHRPVGSMRLNADGYNEIKVAEPNKWELYSRYVYRKGRGEIPKGSVLVHLNGISNDDRIENLELMTKSEVARLNQQGLYGKNQQINESAIALARLNDKIGKAKRRKKSG